MITITNISSEILTIIATDAHFRCELAPKRKIPLSEDAYNQLSFDTGFQAMISMGYLRIEGVDDGTFEVPEVVADGYDDAAVEKIMREHNITEFAKLIPKATTAMKSAFVKYAVKYSVVDAGFSALLKKYCDVDILEAIAHAREAVDVAAPATTTI